MLGPPDFGSEAEQNIDAVPIRMSEDYTRPKEDVEDHVLSFCTSKVRAAAGPNKSVW